MSVFWGLSKSLNPPKSSVGKNTHQLACEFQEFQLFCRFFWSQLDSNANPLLAKGTWRNLEKLFFVKKCVFSPTFFVIISSVFVSEGDNMYFQCVCVWGWKHVFSVCLCLRVTTCIFSVFVPEGGSIFSVFVSEAENMYFQCVCVWGWLCVLRGPGLLQQDVPVHRASAAVVTRGRRHRLPVLLARVRDGN